MSETGGYLIPEYIDVHKAGRRAALWRWVGLCFRRHDWWLRGTEQINIHKALARMRDEISVIQYSSGQLR
jgi:hypothetical protein